MIKTNTNEKSSQANIPYNTDTGVLGKILDDLKNSSNEGIHIKTLWANIGQTDNKNKSYTLTMAKFLGLLDSDGTKVWLTQLGRSLGYVSGDKRNTILAQNLPEVYKTMFKWIKYSANQEIFANDIKVRFINTYGSLSSPIILDRAVASFLNYCQYISLIKYSGKGRGAKAALTEFGKTVLDLPKEDGKPTESETLSSKEKKEPIEKDLPDDAIYPIRITTRDRTFDWDIKTEADLSVIDSVVNSIKTSWKSKREAKPK